jgi:formyl-CoA transferase
MPPLDGITVVGLEQAVAAPFATRQLADLGARVIKIERPGVGDFARAFDRSVRGQSSYFVWLNRSKESLTLDVKAERGREVLDRLLGGADVFVQNLAPGAARRLGFGADDLLRRHPRLIACDVTGYGGDGPWTDRRAYDLLIQFETGLVSLTGTERDEAKVGVSIADIAGGMYAFTGILTALYEREVTGRGGRVEVSLFDALSEWLGAPAAYTRYAGRQPARTGAEHATIAPYGPFRTGDGVVVLAIQTEREWVSFCDTVLEDPGLAVDTRFATNPARVEHRDALRAIIERRLAAMDTASARALLDRARVASAHRNSVTESLDHPVLTGRDRWHEVATPGGPVMALLPPTARDGDGVRLGPVPALGEHTDAILRRLGYGADDVEAMREDGVV